MMEPMWTKREAIQVVRKGDKVQIDFPPDDPKNRAQATYVATHDGDPYNGYDGCEWTVISAAKGDS